LINRQTVSKYQPVALFLFLLAVYLLTYTPRINSSDGLAMFSTAESLARRGALDVEQIRWMELQQGTYGLDGLLYSRKGVGVPLAMLPLTWLGLVIPWFGPVGVSLLFNAIITALTAVLILAYLQALGYSRRAGLITALTFGLATLAWPYAKSLFSDPFSGFLLLAAAYALLKLKTTLPNISPALRQNILAQTLNPLPRPSAPLLPGSLMAALAGLCLGWNVATRYAEALFLPVFGLLLLYYLVSSTYDLRFTTIVPEAKRSGIYDLRSFLKKPSFILHHSSFILAFSAPIGLSGLGLVAFNLSRYGDPLNTGYLPAETFSAIWWQGIWGQLFSPGRGLLLYSPVFLLSLMGLPAFFRRHRPEAVLALSVILIHLLLYGKWFMWHGGFAWGPRFMVPTLPFWAILLAPVADLRFTLYDLRGKLFILLALLGSCIQLLLVLVDFTPFQGFLLDTGLPLFDPQTFFDPQFSPLWRGWAFITSENLDLAWTWEGRVNGWLLAALLINVSMTGVFLWRGANNRISESASQPDGQTVGKLSGLLFPALPILTTLLAAALLLAHVHRLPPAALQQAVAALNAAVRPTDAIILNYPDATAPFAELYKGHAPVLGLNIGGSPPSADIQRRINDTLAGHPQVWWLPNWLPPQESAVEQSLLTAGFRARAEEYTGQRLSLFAVPGNLPFTPAEAMFGNAIRLTGLAFPAATQAGAALPVELHWQAQGSIANNYHVFIHLVDAGGNKIAQADGQPALWSRPTATWAIGEEIIDRHGLWLPSDAPPGDYTLRVGLYRPTDGERLRLPTGADSAEFLIRINQ
jgi:hypothetical protein